MKLLVSFITVALALLAPLIGRSANSVLGFAGLTRGTGDMDPQGAAGPNGILSLCNNGVVYYTKIGTTNWTVVPESSFFLPGVCCDAKALFDPASQRFFIVAQDNDGTTSHVAVSKNSDPQTATTNDWRFYKFATGVSIDYPGMGLDGQAVYVAYGSTLQQWLVYDKAQLISGATNATTLRVVSTPAITTYVDSTGASKQGALNQGLQPVTVVGSQSPGDVAYCVTFSATNTIRLYAITNVLGGVAPVLFSTNVPCPSLGSIDTGVMLFAPQLGTANRLNTGNSAPAMGNAFWRNGELWFCGVVGSSNQPQRTIVRWYKILTGGYPNGQASLGEWGDLDGGTNTWSQQPSIGGNPRGDVCLVYTVSSSNSFPAIYSSIRKAGQSSFQTVVVKTSVTNHTVSTRWSDYSGVSPDPQDQTFWVTHLFIDNPNDPFNSIGTWWANIIGDDLFYVDKNAVGAEVGTRALPFHTVRNAQTAVSGAKTLVVSPANYPEPTLPLRLDKNIRVENPYPSGTVHIGP